MKQQTEIVKQLEKQLGIELGAFYNKQIEQILLGLKSGLSEKKILIYAKPVFSDKQMEQIRLALEYGLSIDKVKLIANEKFDWAQMEEIRNGFENGLSEKQVRQYAKPEFDWRQMSEKRAYFENYNKTKTKRRNRIIAKSILFVFSVGVLWKGQAILLSRFNTEPFNLFEVIVLLFSVRAVSDFYKIILSKKEK